MRLDTLNRVYYVLYIVHKRVYYVPWVVRERVYYVPYVVHESVYYVPSVVRERVLRTVHSRHVSRATKARIPCLHMADKAAPASLQHAMHFTPGV